MMEYLQKAKWIVKNIPFGSYAIKAFHDEDQDDEIDTKFLFNSDSLKIEIKLINL